MRAAGVCALLVVGVVLSACGGGGAQKQGQAESRIGAPTIARPTGKVRPHGRPEVVRTAPSLHDLGKLRNPIGLGDKRAGCFGSTLQPQRKDVAQLVPAMLCLLNAERAARGLKPLRENPELDRAAAAHAREMVARSFFAHDSKSGDDFVDRVIDAGYTRDFRHWTIAENIAWGSGADAAAAEVIDAWMASAGHKANVLGPDFRDAGIGVAAGIPPRKSASGATYSITFAERRR